MLKRFEKNNGQKGLTLIELMVGIAVSLVLLAGVVTVLLRITVAGGESIQATRLNQQLRGAVDLMTKELQRAGYVNWASKIDSDGLTDVNEDGFVDFLDFYETLTPAVNDMGGVSLFVFPTPGDQSSGAPVTCSEGCDCVLYSYDIDSNGDLNTGVFELFGFRWNNNRIEMRTGGSPASCSSGAWQPITDDYVSITGMSLDLVYADEVMGGGVFNNATAYVISGETWGGALSTTCTPSGSEIEDDKCLWRRNIAISVEGVLVDDPDVRGQIDSSVKIKNDHFQSTP